MSTIARPYVAAAFEYAAAKKDLPAWETLLAAAADLAKDKAIVALLQNPQVTKEQLSGLFCEVLKPLLDTEKTNFIQLLAANNRLAVLPQIFTQFKLAREEKEKTITAQVVSATPLSKPYQEKLVKALSKRLDRKVELQCDINPELLGGVIVRAGDLVIDGSVSGKLTRLNDFI